MSRIEETEEVSDVITEELSDGTQIQHLPDGTIIKLFIDGTREQITKDGVEIIVHSDGTRTQKQPNGIILNIYKDGHCKQTNPDGTIIETYPDNRRVQRNIDGTVIEVFSDGSRIQTSADGEMLKVAADGSVTVVSEPVSERGDKVPGIGRVPSVYKRNSENMTQWKEEKERLLKRFAEVEKEKTMMQMELTKVGGKLEQYEKLLISEADEHNKILQDKTSLIVELQDKIRQLERQVNTQVLAETDKNVNGLTKENLQSKLLEAESKNRLLQERFTQVEKKVNDITAEEKRANKECTILKQKVNDLIDKSGKVAEEVTALQQEKQKLNYEVDKLHKDLSQALTRNSELEMKVTKLLQTETVLKSNFYLARYSNNKGETTEVIETEEKTQGSSPRNLKGFLFSGKKSGKVAELEQRIKELQITVDQKDLMLKAQIALNKENMAKLRQVNQNQKQDIPKPPPRKDSQPTEVTKVTVTEPEVKVQTVIEKPVVAEDVDVSKYEKMLKSGVPEGAVKMTMQRDNVDPGLLFKSEANLQKVAPSVKQGQKTPVTKNKPKVKQPANGDPRKQLLEQIRKGPSSELKKVEVPVEKVAANPEITESKTGSSPGGSTVAELCRMRAQQRANRVGRIDEMLNKNRNLNQKTNNGTELEQALKKRAEKS